MLACSEHVCSNCRVYPVFKTKLSDRASFLKRTRLCKMCLYERGFFNCSVSQSHGLGIFATVYLPFDRLTVGIINEFLGFGVKDGDRFESTICINRGYSAKKRDVSIGKSARCALFCIKCLENWSVSRGGYGLDFISKHPAIAEHTVSYV